MNLSELANKTVIILIYSKIKYNMQVLKGRIVIAKGETQ